MSALIKTMSSPFECFYTFFPVFFPPSRAWSMEEKLRHLRKLEHVKHFFISIEYAKE